MIHRFLFLPNSRAPCIISNTPACSCLFKL
nr:MAG TPA: hypothetical protein [Caudoviricetes sp.]